MFWVIYGILVLTDPFALFFFANSSMVRSTRAMINTYSEVLPGILLTPQLACLIFCIQTIVMLLITIVVDIRRSNEFRKADLTKPKKEQPLLRVREDVLEQEDYVRKHSQT